MKIVINRCFGGFGLSEAAVMRYAEIKGITLYPENEKFSSLCGPTYYIVPKEQRTPELKNWVEATMEERKAYNEAAGKEVLYDRNIPRDDAALVQVVEELGDEASGKCASLEIVEIPDDADWEISEYDGNEHIAEKHRTWC